MRSILIATVIVLSTAAAFAQGHRGIDQFTLFSTARVTGAGEEGDWKHSAGVAIDYAWSRHWTTKVSAEMQEHEAVLTRFVPGPSGAFAPSTYFETFTTYPVDLQLTYRFARDPRFTPFLGAGMRYAHTPAATPPLIVPAGETFAPVRESKPVTRGSAEVSAGMLIGVTPHFGLAFEARRLLRNDGTPFDPLTKVSGGITYRF